MVLALAGTLPAQGVTVKATSLTELRIESTVFSSFGGGGVTTETLPAATDISGGVAWNVGQAQLSFSTQYEPSRIADDLAPYTQRAPMEEGMSAKLTWAGAAVVGTLFLASGLPAQRSQPSQEDLIKLRAEELDKPVFKKANWLFDYDNAKEKAKKEGKLLFTYFTRSYSY